ncbi:MAG: DUF4397 domain-containing protein, partial [Pseudomonadota bacterium]
MTQIKPLHAAVAACALFLAACDDTATVTTPGNANVTAAGGAALGGTGTPAGGDGSAPGGSTDAMIRVIHASPDAPAVNVALNGGTAIEALDYG